MKQTYHGKTSPLTTDSQNRLMAYTTAAGLGAFFAGQNAEAQVTAIHRAGSLSSHVNQGCAAGHGILRHLFLH